MVICAIGLQGFTLDLLQTYKVHNLPAISCHRHLCEFYNKECITGVFLTPDTDLNLVTNIWLLVVQTEYEGVVNLISAAKNNGDVKKVCQQTFVN